MQTIPKYGSMRRFHLDRMSDPTGVSGTGLVATGVVFSDNTVVVCWQGAHARTTVHASIHSVEAIHLHVGQTQLIWHDPICFRCAASLAVDEQNARHCFACGAGQGDTLCFDTYPEP